MKRDALIASFAALSMIAFAAPTSAKTQAEETGASAGKTAKKICRTFDNSATRLNAIKLCLTKAGWKKFDAQAER